MRLVILTGGVATGKTSATRLFKKHGIATVELEDVVSAALQPNSPAFAAILKHFGGSVLRPDGSLNMKALLDAVNADPGDKQVFDDITRPYLAKSAITQILWRWVFRAHVIVIDSAVFFEDIIPEWFFNDIITVTCSPQNQLQRLMSDVGCTEEVAKSRMKAQIPLPFKCAMSTIVLDNNGKLEELEEQIGEVVDRWNHTKTPLLKWPDPFTVLALTVMLFVAVYFLL